MDYYKKYKKYKNKYIKKGGAGIPNINISRKDFGLSPISQIDTFKLLKATSFNQYTYGNRLITLIGELHNNQVLMSNENEMTIKQYCLSYSSANSEIYLEYPEQTPTELISSIGSIAIKDIVSEIGETDYLFRIKPIDYRKHLLSTIHNMNVSSSQTNNYHIDNLLYHQRFEDEFQNQSNINIIKHNLLIYIQILIDNKEELFKLDLILNTIDKSCLLTCQQEINAICDYIYREFQRTNITNKNVYLNNIQENLKQLYMLISDYNLLKNIYINGITVNKDIVILIGEFHCININNKLIHNNNFIKLDTSVDVDVDNLNITNSYISKSDSTNRYLSNSE
jgi:hypothetical protein